MGRMVLRVARSTTRRFTTAVPTTSGSSSRRGRGARIAPAAVGRCEPLGRWPTSRSIAGHRVLPSKACGRGLQDQLRGATSFPPAKMPARPRAASERAVSDTLLHRLFPNDLHHVEGLHQAIREAIPARGHVLDLGCGVNADLESYRTDEREVSGADFQRHPDLRHSEWFRLLGPSGAIPFPDGHFDTIVSVMVLEHVVDPTTFLREAARVLRPGGCFIGHTISGAHYVTLIRRFVGLLPHRLNQALVKKLYGRERS